MINPISILALACSAFVPTIAVAPRNAPAQPIQNVYPDSVQIVRNDVAIQNANFLGFVDTDGTDYPLEFGYCYQLAFATLTWEGSDLSAVRSVSFAKYSTGNVSNLLEPYPNFYVPTFNLYSPASDYYYCRNYLGVKVDFLTFSKTATSSGSYGTDQYNTGYPYYDVLYRPSTSGPYYMGADLSSVQLLSYLSDFVSELNQNSQTINATAYNNGYNDGYDAGHDAGYQDGYDSITSEGLIVSNLFGAVFGIPIGVLNGLSPFALWSIPIISIAFTFLFFGLILWIVKKFI